MHLKKKESYAFLFGNEENHRVCQRLAAKCGFHVSLSSLLIMKGEKLCEQKGGDLQRKEEAVGWSRR